MFQVWQSALINYVFFIILCRPNIWQVYLEHLQPFFKLCNLLSTTFVALLTDLQLMDMLKSTADMHLLDLTALLACAKHHMGKAGEARQHVSSIINLGWGNSLHACRWSRMQLLCGGMYMYIQVVGPFRC